MMCLKLFLAFLKIGAVSFGGGYGMIALIRETVVGNGWLSEEELLNFIAVSESTPGPIAINMATFVGSSQAGFFGALCATFGVVLPAFLIILLISALLKNLMKYAGVKAALRGIRPAVVALILVTAVTVGLETLLGIKNLPVQFSPDWKGLGIFAGIALFNFAVKKIKGKKPSPILSILLCGIAGVLVYFVL